MKHPIRFLGSVLVGAAFVAAFDVAPVSAQEAAGVDVTLTTDDKMSIVGTFWAGSAANAPGVVLLHMYKSNRAAWQPLVRHLHDRGCDVLAIDMRGHGGSAKQGKADLSAKVEKRDAKLFQDMHKDAIAAVRHLVKEAKSDPSKIVIVGASVGCSVAIDTARRYPKEVSAVACLSPGANFLGLNTVEQAKAWPKDKPLLLMTHASEAADGAPQVHDAIPASRLITYDDATPDASKDEPMWAHGTKMFGRIPLVEQTVASFVSSATGSEKDDVVLDGVVAADGSEAEHWAKATDVSSDASGVRAAAVGRRVVFGGKAPDGSAMLLVSLESGSQKVTLEDGTEGRRGILSIAAIDLATGSVAWSVPTAEQLKGTPIELPPAMAARVVKADGVTTVEGEWRAIKVPQGAGFTDTTGVRCVAWFSTSPIAPPSESDPLRVPDRIVLKSR